MKDKIHVKICTGTACFVMGGSELIMLEDNLPEKLKDKVAITGSTCLEYCKDEKYGKAPFVEVDRHIIGEATIPKVLKYLENLVES